MFGDTHLKQKEIFKVRLVALDKVHKGVSENSCSVN